MQGDAFRQLLRQWSVELHEDNPTKMNSAALIPTKNVIDEQDVALLGRGLDAGLITLYRGGRFNTLDRPKPGGRWAMLSRGQAGGWYNAEYLPQIAAYVAAILDHGFDIRRVLFELPATALQLDLAIVDDDGKVVVLGEAKREIPMLDRLIAGMLGRYEERAPGPESKLRGDEVRQLAWRLWTVRPQLCWLIGPGARPAFECSFSPLAMRRVPELPSAAELGLDHAPTRSLDLPRLA